MCLKNVKNEYAVGTKQALQRLGLLWYKCNAMHAICLYSISIIFSKWFNCIVSIWSILNVYCLYMVSTVCQSDVYVYIWCLLYVYLMSMSIYGVFLIMYIVIQGRFQDFFQGVAEISSGGGENLPGVAKQIARYPLPLSVFCFIKQHY